MFNDNDKFDDFYDEDELSKENGLFRELSDEDWIDFFDYKDDIDGELRELEF